MKNSKLIIPMVMALTVLCVVFAVLYSAKDRNSPTISFSSTPVSYNEGDDWKELLEGATATDTKDGDLSTQIIVSKLIPSEDGKSAYAFYAVNDTNGNMATGVRSVTYTAAKKEPKLVPSPTPTPSPSPSPQPSPTPIPGAPVIKLTTHTVTADKENLPYLIDYVKSIKDDVDSEESLFRQIIVEGRPKAYEKGSYVLVLYVVDSDGNESNKESLTLLVT